MLGMFILPHPALHKPPVLLFPTLPVYYLRQVAVSLSGQSATSCNMSEVQLLQKVEQTLQDAFRRDMWHIPRKIELRLSIYGKEIKGVLTLTSLLSDSAIFLLRSIQRDECLIPIRASKNVLIEVKIKQRVPTVFRVPPSLPWDNSHSHPKPICSFEILRLSKDTKLHEVPPKTSQPQSVVVPMVEKFAVRRCAFSERKGKGIIWHHLR